jgi:inorganic pyrophosphatase
MLNNRRSHFHTIKQDRAPEEIALIIEIQKGDVNKYEYNHELGILELDRVLYGPTHYPVNYCDIPGTWNVDDNDPLDAVVFSTAKLVPGTLVWGRVVGVMEMEDNNEKDPKIICVTSQDPRYDHIKSVDDLAPYQKKDIQTFMEIYKIAQTGAGSVVVGEFLGPKEAYKIIESGIDEYEKRFGGAISKIIDTVS